MRRSLAIATTTFVLGTLAGQAFADRQPHMRDALRHLEKALSALESATPDKGGHRVKAIALTKDAIAQTREGIEHDNKH